VRVVTKADGTKDDGATYRPYGEQQLGFAGTTPQTKGFIGQRLDDKTGLMYLHARYYDPQLGRFIQADPSDPTAVGVGINRYAYAGDNPVAYLDQTGLALTQGPRQGNKEERDVQLAAGEEPGEGGGWSGFAKDRELDMPWTYDKLAKEKVPFPPSNEINYQHYQRSIELREELLNKGIDPAAVNGGKVPEDIDPSLTLEGQLGSRGLWNKSTNFRGNTVYQRDDLINPNLVDKRGRTNLERMQEGLAPLAADGKSVNLHHIDQTPEGPLVELKSTEHWEINHSQEPTKIDRQDFRSYREAYWKERAKDFSKVKEGSE
jgi:RHS repeat-associated protein